jgi:hypothetical protein
MPLTLGWQEVLVRLGLALVAGAVLGVNRSERGHAAGLRTTILVSLAAAAAMIQVNLLLALSDHKQSLVQLDLMRLPLGVLSGMGCIGGGAILKRGEIVHGVTTAATMWFVTVMGLCFGGGQIGLGLELYKLLIERSSTTISNTPKSNGSPGAFVFGTIRSLFPIRSISSARWWQNGLFPGLPSVVWLIQVQPAMHSSA